MQFGRMFRDVFRSPEPDAAFGEVLLDIVRRRVPKRVLRIRSSDKPWFTPECRRAYDRKQASYRAWTRARTRER